MRLWNRIEAIAAPPKTADSGVASQWWANWHRSAIKILLYWEFPWQRRGTASRRKNAQVY